MVNSHGAWLVFSVLVGTAGCRQLFGFDDANPLVDASRDAPKDGSGDAGACSTAGLTCNGTATATSCEGACWVSCTELVSHTTGATRCDDWGGELARFDDSQTQSCLRASVAPTGDVWIGLSQMAGAAAPQDGWRWTGDSTTASFFNWAPGQPDDGDGNETGKEQCAHVPNGTSEWQDATCGSMFAFTCWRG